MYSISIDGKVYSSYSKKILKPSPSGDKSKYMSVSLCKNNKKYTRKLSRLILETYIGPCPENMEACHIDGDNFNDHLYNLRWGTKSQNQKDAVRHGTAQGLKNHGNRCNLSKLTESQVIEIRNLYKTKNYTQKELGEKYGVHQTAIHYIVTKRNWSKTF